jgi:hypothetical protein
MQDGDQAAHRIDQINRNAVRHGDSEQKPGAPGRVSVEPFMDDQASGVVVPEHPGAMNLTGDDDGPEPGHSPPERSPAVEHVPRGACPPKSEIKWVVGVTPAGDPGDEAKLVAPACQLVARDRAFDRGLDHSSIRSIDAPSALSRS